jgi:hypothetical protein
MQECTCRYQSAPPTRTEHCTSCRDACVKECEASNGRLRKSKYPFVDDNGQSGTIRPGCQECNRFCTDLANGYCIQE